MDQGPIGLREELTGLRKVLSAQCGLGFWGSVVCLRDDLPRVWKGATGESSACSWPESDRFKLRLMVADDFEI